MSDFCRRAAPVDEKAHSVEKKFSTRNVLYFYERETFIVTANEFIFSEKRKIRIARHVSFWAVVCLLKFYSDLYGSSLTDVFALSSFKQSFSSLSCFIPLYFFSAYSFICILLPRYLQKKKYTAFIIAAFVVALVNFIGGIFLSMLHYKIMGWYMTGINKSLAPFRGSIYQGIILAFFSTGGVVTAIKLTKNWYLQQLENTKLAKQKSDKEIKLLKAHIRPVFLFQSLNILHTKIISGENDAPTMVLQLSELLSHLLYDCDKELISLKQELKMVELLIDIKKFDRHRNLSTKMFIHGNEDKKYISPLLLFSYVQTVLDDAEETHCQKDSLDIVLNIEDKALLCEFHNCIETAAEFNLFYSSESFKTAGNTKVYA